MNEKIENIKELKQWILKNYKPDLNSDTIKSPFGDSYWETESFDDTFQMGIDVGFNIALYEISKLLGMRILHTKDSNVVVGINEE